MKTMSLLAFTLAMSVSSRLVNTHCDYASSLVARLRIFLLTVGWGIPGLVRLT